LSAAESIKYIYPELILLIFSVAILTLGLFSKKSGLYGILSLLGVTVSAFCLHNNFPAPAPIFSNLLLSDSFSRFFKELSLVVTFIVILISMGYRIIKEEDEPEYYFLLLVITCAMMLAVSSGNLVMIYVAMEAVSIISYILVGFRKHDALSNEAALKYFLFGTLATGIMLYGISFIYGLFGTTDLSVVHTALVSKGINNVTLSAALLLIFAGIAFKCALVPFHMWVPDAYQGAPTSITAFISVGPKIVGFVVLLRVFLKDFLPVFPAWSGFFTVICVATMTAGNIIAISQTNIKRMLAYSSIAQAGYILIGFITGTPLGIMAVLFYIFVYAIMNLGAFACVTLISDSIKSDSIKDYAGLSKRDPVSAFMLALFLLSLAGIPPLAGFMGKFLLFAAAIESKLVFLAIAAAINSVIAFYYYVYVIKCMYLDEPQILDVQPKSTALQTALIIAIAGILIIGIWPLPVLSLVNASISR